MSIHPVLRVTVTWLFLALVSGCAMGPHKPTALCASESLAFGRVLIDEDGTPVAHHPLLVYLVPTERPRQPPPPTVDQSGLTLTNNAGYFRIIVPLGTYHLAVQYEVNRPLPKGHDKEWLTVDPGVTASITCGQSASYLGTLILHVRQTAPTQSKEAKTYILSDSEVADDRGEAYDYLLTENQYDKSLPRKFSLLARSPTVKPVVVLTYANEPGGVLGGILRGVVQLLFSAPPTLHFGH